MGSGKTVARPLRATPCRASFHQSYGLIPSRSTPGVLFIIMPIFSSRVIRAITSAAFLCIAASLDSWA